MREIFEGLYAVPWGELPTKARDAWDQIRYGRRKHHGNHGVVVIPDWDELAEEQREIVVAQHDAQTNPAGQQERETAFEGGYYEAVSQTGNTIKYRYWSSLRTLTANQFACLASGLDPDLVDAGKTLPTEAKALQQAKAIERLAIDQGIAEASPPAWLAWAEQHRGLFFLHRRFRAELERCSFGTTNLADPRTRSSEIQRVVGDAGNMQSPDDWKAFAVATANEIGLKKWKSGQRQISARGVSKEVAAEMEKEENHRYWGGQGPRSVSNIRNEALKGWKFIPPTPA